MSEGDDSGDGTGDSVCWLGMLCPECGAMPSDGDARCWRCGAPAERSGGASIPPRPAEHREAT